MIITHNQLLPSEGIDNSEINRTIHFVFGIFDCELEPPVIYYICGQLGSLISKSILLLTEFRNVGLSEDLMGGFRSIIACIDDLGLCKGLTHVDCAAASAD